MVSLIASLVLSQPAGVFPVAFERVRPDGQQDIVFVKDSRDKGQVLGQGSHVVQLPISGGCAFVANGPAIMVFDANGKKILDHHQIGMVSAGRPAIDPSGNFLVAEFVAEGESELWRIPLRGKGPAKMLTWLNKGDGTANPSFEMDGRALLFKMGSSWVRFDLASGQTEPLSLRPVVQDLPQGTLVLEIRPSPLMPDVAAVSVEIPSTKNLRWIMVWDRKTGRVGRVSPEGADATLADWSRDGRYILFHATDRDSGRVTVQAVRPTGGEPQLVAVVKEAGR